MGCFLHRTTKQFLQSVPPDNLPEPLANYISDPDMSGVKGVPDQYWKITGDNVSEMNQSEKDAVDAALLTAQRDSAVAELDWLEGTIRQLVKLILSEINILRAEHSLPARTFNQLKTQIYNGYGS